MKDSYNMKIDLLISYLGVTEEISLKLRLKFGEFISKLLSLEIQKINYKLIRSW